MSVRLLDICRASVVDGERSALEGCGHAEEAHLSAYVQDYYGPPFVAEFVQEALQAAQYELAQQIATASERMGQSLNPEHPQLTIMGNSMDEWLRAYARQRAREDIADLQRNRH